MDWLQQTTCNTSTFWVYTQTKCGPNWGEALGYAFIVLGIIFIGCSLWRLWRER